MLFIANTHANSKYSYHFWTFKFLKYSYQKWIKGVQSSPRDLFSKSLSGNMMSGTIEVRAGRAQMFQLHAVKKLGQILQVLSPPCQKYHWKKLKRLFCTLCHNSQRDNCHQMYVHWRASPTHCGLSRPACSQCQVARLRTYNIGLQNGRAATD